MNTNVSSSSSGSRPSAGRYYGGWFFLILAFFLPLMTPLIPLLGFNKTITTTLMGGLLLGGPEISIVIAIALWGKPTFNYFMGYLYQWLKRLKPADKVSVSRYYFGLVLLISSSIPSWVLAYFPTLLGNTMRILVVLLFDIVFVMSFFVLGGDFWDKVCALFIPNSIKIIKK